jgi:hypothetical protein
MHKSWKSISWSCYSNPIGKTSNALCETFTSGAIRISHHTISLAVAVERPETEQLGLL